MSENWPAMTVLSESNAPPPLHTMGYCWRMKGKEGMDVGCRGPGTVSIQSGPVVSGARRHTVTLCLIGAGQSLRGMKGYAHPVLLPLSLSLSQSLKLWLPTCTSHFFKAYQLFKSTVHPEIKLSHPKFSQSYVT